MATPISTLVLMVRDLLNAPAATDEFWTDAELIRYMNRGIRDLWRSITNNHQDYFLTIDTTHVTLAASASSLTGVPTDVAIVRKIEPLSTSIDVAFVPRKYNDPEMVEGRRSQAVDPSVGQVIYYAITSAGAPVAAPVINVAPAITSTISLRLSYIPTLTEVTAVSTMPLPGEADQALVSWTMAYAIGRQRQEQAPDPTWLATYASEKISMLQQIAPRETDRDEVADAVFEALWP